MCGSIMLTLQLQYVKQMKESNIKTINDNKIETPNMENRLKRKETRRYLS